VTEGDGFDVRSLAITLRPGAHLVTHCHSWGQLVFARSGVMRVSTAAETWLTPATKAIWLPASLEHRIDIRGEVAMRTLYIAPKRAAPLPGEPATLEVQPLLRELILHIVHLGMLSPDRPEHDRMAGVLVDLLGQARREDMRLPLPGDARARAAALRLQEAPGEAGSLAGLASASGTSLRTLQRLFPRETGLTLEAWRQKARLIYAMARLAAGESVTSTALDSGYENVGAFIAAFSRQFGMTPGRYRATARQL
jgi:AraC-like DNA-binding protein/quercetin dioxygenase-like cupin family protein